MEQILLVIQVCFIFRMYAAYSGKKDAMIYAMKGSNSIPGNEHITFSVERIIVFALIPASFFLIQMFDIYVVYVNCALGFSFWHNGFYFMERKKIDGAYKGFTDNQKSKGTNLFEFNYNTRLVLEIISWCPVLVYMCYLKNY